MPRFMLMLRADEDGSFGDVPPDLYAAISALAERWRSAGVLLDAAGLAPTAMSVRITLRGGEITAAGGPFTEHKENVSAYALVQAGTQGEAVRLSTEILSMYLEHWPAWQGNAEVRQAFTSG
jgi:hypothetical protein